MDTFRGFNYPFTRMFNLLTRGRRRVTRRGKKKKKKKKESIIERYRISWKLRRGKSQSYFRSHFRLAPGNFPSRGGGGGGGGGRKEERGEFNDKR